MDKNVLEAKIGNGKWVKLTQEPKSIFILENGGEMQQKSWVRKPNHRPLQKQSSHPEEKEEMTAHVRENIHNRTKNEFHTQINFQPFERAPTWMTEDEQNVQELQDHE